MENMPEGCLFLAKYISDFRKRFEKVLQEIEECEANGISLCQLPQEIQFRFMSIYQEWKYIEHKRDWIFQSFDIGLRVEEAMFSEGCSIRELALNKEIYTGCLSIAYCLENDFYDISLLDEFIEQIRLRYEALDNIKDFEMKSKYYQILDHFSKINEKDGFKRIVDIANKSEEN